MFGSCKSISRKYSIFRKCYFSERKIFSCVWLHFKKNFEKNFLVFGEEEGKDKPDKPRRRTARSHCSSIVAAVDRDLTDRRAATIAPLVNRRTVMITPPSIAIYRNEWRRSTSALVGRSHRSSIAPLVDRCSPI